MALQQRYTLQEVDPSSGRTTKSYSLSGTNTGLSTEKQRARLDQIPLQPTTVASTRLEASVPKYSLNAQLNLYFVSLLVYLKTLFLPTGYPHTVTADYTPYQIYDSIQALASSIAGLLSSRAVLQSLNVISSTASDGTIPADSAAAATAATLLSIIQSTLSNLTSILFASYAAPRISINVKFYRFLADIANDATFVLDLLAPSLPGTFGAVFSYLPASELITRCVTLLSLHGLEVLSPFVPSPRVTVLCVSSMLRAICGVAGGSSKAVLSAHFARNNPESVGDLNAKDGSQETVVNLLGMWIGGFVVSRVGSAGATWTWMLVLLAIHLWANYRAVKSVRLSGLNRERAGRVLMRIAENDVERVDWSRLSIDAIGASEHVMGIRRLISRWLPKIGVDPADESNMWRDWKVGVSFEEFMHAVALDGYHPEQEGSLQSMSEVMPADRLSTLISVFESEAYLIWCSQGGHEVTIILKRNAMPLDQLKAWYHAFVLRRSWTLASPAEDKREVTKMISDTLKTAKDHFEGISIKLKEAGWDLDSTILEDRLGMRIDVTRGSQVS